MPVELKLHPRAEKELRAAFLWYRDRNALVAEAFRAEAEHAIESIAENPVRWPKLSDVLRSYVFPRFPITVVYRLKSDFVEVIAAAHQKRKPGYWGER